MQALGYMSKSPDEAIEALVQAMHAPDIRELAIQSILRFSKPPSKPILDKIVADPKKVKLHEDAKAALVRIG